MLFEPLNIALVLRSCAYTVYKHTCIPRYTATVQSNYAFLEVCTEVIEIEDLLVQPNV